MLMFMEGLPRSGKSYETCAYYILPALEQGRCVDAYVEGLNHAKFAEMTGKPVEEIQELLQFIPAENVKEIYKYVRKDSLVVIDEMQDFWQTSRQPLSPEITTFVTQHGHDGHDIIGMGQDLNDVHKIWRNRVARKFVMQKQDAIGKDNSYLWTAYAAKRTDRGLKFEKINSGSRKYEERFFGLYKSHTDGTSNFENLGDDRTNLLKNNSLRYGVLGAVVVAVIAVYFLVGFFTDPEQITGKSESKTPVAQVKQPTDFDRLSNQFENTRSSNSPVPGASQPAVEQEEEQYTYIAPDQYVDEVANKWRLRLSGQIRMSDSGEWTYIIDAYDAGLHLKERFYSHEIEALGWTVKETGYGVLLTLDDRSYVVRPWPIDPFGRASNAKISSL
jgi:zona occludens toxin